MRFDTADEALRWEATRWLRSLSDAEIADLTAVLRSSPGYYPSTLAQLWRAEMDRRGLSNGSLGDGGDGSQRLPVCHPADYEWRFTDESAVALVRRASTGLGAGAVVVHVGAPTTFVVGRTRLPRLTHVLLERGESVIRALGNIGHIYQVDLTRHKPPSLGAGAAIIDPPWYPADTRAFLWATNAACVAGARIVLCQPTLAARPGVAEERAALLDELPRLGYACMRIDAACIRYRTPHFEVTSLKATAPDLYVPDDWRVGDALILEKVGEPLAKFAPPPAVEVWTEVPFGPVRIKLRRTQPPDLGHIVPGDVLDTVSRRDPIREQIGLWTSGNRIFSLDNPETFSRVIAQCHADVMQSQFSSSSTLSHAREAGLEDPIARRLFDLLLIEIQEHALRRES